VNRELYTGGEYLARNAGWHAEDSAWKASRILTMLERHDLRPRTICEVGCGVGEILRELHDRLDHAPEFVGYEISPHALERASAHSTERLEFRLGNVLDHSEHFEMVLLIDVIEHVEDYFSLLRGLRERSDYTVMHIPLELCALSVLLEAPLISSRERLGHLHFYTKETALGMLRGMGYEIVDWTYTAASSQYPRGSWKLQALERARRIVFPLSETAAVRLFGGYSLLVLAR
jgi:hypothetical protein